MDHYTEFLREQTETLSPDDEDYEIRLKIYLVCNTQVKWFSTCGIIEQLQKEFACFQKGKFDEYTCSGR